MKKYYADIYHASTSTHITISEYSEKAVEKSIEACIKQRGFKANECIWTVRIDEDFYEPKRSYGSVAGSRPTQPDDGRAIKREMEDKDDDYHARG